MSKPQDFFTSPYVPGTLRKNILINGCMRVGQRGASGAIASASWDFGKDRASAFKDSGAYNWTFTGPTSLGFDVQGLSTTTPLTVSGSNLVAPYRTMVEGLDVEHLIKGEEVTLSFYVYATDGGTFPAQIICHNTTSGLDLSMTKEFTISAATWTKVELTYDIPSDYIGKEEIEKALTLYIGAASGPDRNTTPDVWEATSAVRTTSSCTNWADTIGDIFAISQVQLEVGNVATEFEQRPVGEELALCQRYFWKPSSTVGGAFNHYHVSYGRCNTICFPVEMRDVPTLTIITPPSIQPGTGTVGALSGAAVRQSFFYATWAVTGGTAGYANHFSSFDFEVDAEL